MLISDRSQPYTAGRAAQAGRTTGPTASAQAARLLHVILNIAVADEDIASNPCRLRHADLLKASRPSRALTAAEGLQLAEHVERTGGPALAHPVTRPCL